MSSDPLTRRRAAVRAVRRAVLARRRWLAALLTAVAVAAGLHAAAAPPPPSVAVPVAARDLPAGHLLAADDLTWAAYPPEAVPEGLVSEAAGSVLAAPVRAGEPVTDVRLVGPALVEADASRAAVPVRLPDAGMADLLDVGDRIDLLAVDPQAGGAQVVAAGVPVLAVPPARSDAAVGQPGALVVVGVEPHEVPALADAGVRLFLTYAFAR